MTQFAIARPLRAPLRNSSNVVMTTKSLILKPYVVLLGEDIAVIMRLTQAFKQ